MKGLSNVLNFEYLYGYVPSVTETEDCNSLLLQSYCPQCEKKKSLIMHGIDLLNIFDTSLSLLKLQEADHSCRDNTKLLSRL